MSVKDKKADGQPQEVEKMLDRMVSNRPAKIEEQPDLNKNWCFHNTKKLLQRYRSTLMCIAVALDDLDEECLGSLGVRFSAMEEFAQQMDIDLSGTYIESRLRTMQRNKLMLQYIDKAIKSMRVYAKTARSFTGFCISSISAPTRTSARRTVRWWRSCGKRACRCPAAPSTAAATWP